jgi:hypothetical protein
MRFLRTTAIAALAADPDVLRYTGKVLVAAALSDLMMSDSSEAGILYTDHTGLTATCLGSHRCGQTNRAHALARTSRVGAHQTGLLDAAQHSSNKELNRH